MATLLDTNLLVLLVIGAVDTRWIGQHKRSKTFVASDWHLLLRLVDGAPLLTTPHILAEASNLLRSGGMKPPAHDKLMMALAGFIDGTPEERVRARHCAGDEAFLRLGLTDTAIVKISRSDVHVLTTDLDLYLAVLARGHPVTNFNHLRDR